MKKSFYSSMFKNIKAFVMSSSLVGGSVLLYLYYRSSQNRATYEKNLNDDTAKDMTRIGYEYFGINWGYKADSMVSNYLLTILIY